MGQLASGTNLESDLGRGNDAWWGCCLFNWMFRFHHLTSLLCKREGPEFTDYQDTLSKVHIITSSLPECSGPSRDREHVGDFLENAYRHHQDLNKGTGLTGLYCCLHLSWTSGMDKVGLKICNPPDLKNLVRRKYKLTSNYIKIETSIRLLFQIDSTGY